ncbi:MAG: hypothetical protein ACQEVA_12385 [Myxococcota bacterium]
MEMIEEPKPKTARNIVIALVVLAILAGFGAIGHFSGTGWFGHRQMLYGTGEVYLLNLGDKPREVTVDGRETVTVEPSDAEIAELIGGRSELVVRDENGDVIDTYEIETDNSHAFLKVSEQGCVVVSDVTSFYKKGGADEIEFVEFLEQDDRVYIPGSTNVIWPRKRFPQKLRGSGGPGLWVENVACQLFEEEDFLRAYLRVRLLDRMGVGKEDPARGGAPPRRR